MSTLSKQLPVEVERLLGDPHPLTDRIASPRGLAALASLGVNLPATVQDLPTLRGFLTWYRTEVLIPVELPAVRRAFEFTACYQVRELLAADRALANEPRLRHFAEASRAVGRSQLWRLLPMRDQRLVRRYWQAVEAGEAHAWHVLIYGVVLAVFSLPLRQGMMHYASRTLAGFVDSASRSLQLPAADCAALLDEETGTLRSAAELALGPGKPRLILCG